MLQRILKTFDPEIKKSLRNKRLIEEVTKLTTITKTAEEKSVQTSLIAIADLLGRDVDLNLLVDKVPAGIAIFIQIHFISLNRGSQYSYLNLNYGQHQKIAEKILDVLKKKFNFNEHLDLIHSMISEFSSSRLYAENAVIFNILICVPMLLVDSKYRLDIWYKVKKLYCDKTSYERMKSSLFSVIENHPQKNLLKHIIKIINEDRIDADDCFAVLPQATEQELIRTFICAIDQHNFKLAEKVLEFPFDPTQQDHCSSNSACSRLLVAKQYSWKLTDEIYSKLINKLSTHGTALKSKSSLERKAEKYKRISYSQAKENKEYLKFFIHIFYEVAAILVQRTWRKKKIRSNKEGKEKYIYKGKRIEPLNGTLTMRFIKEPISDEFSNDHLQKIKERQYTQLNFDDPDFVRNLFKLLRANLINTNQLINAWCAYYMRIQFKWTPTKQYSLEEKGPFNLSSISFVSEKMTEKFKTEIKQLPDDEKIYFSANLSRAQTIYFLYLGLKLNEIQYQNSPFPGKLYKLYPQFRTILKKFIQQYQLKDSEKQRLHDLVDQLDDELKHEFAIKELLEFLQFQCRLSLNQILFDREKENIKFLLVLLRVSEETPGVEISLDYDPNILGSPIICFNMLSLKAFEALQNCIFEPDQIVKPFATVGRITPRFMRELIKNPAKYGAQKTSRPIVYTHPDVCETEVYHSYRVFPLIAAWHDLLHTWKCSLNIFKALSEFIMIIEENETGYSMSKNIWYHVDRDFYFGAKYFYYMLLGDKQNADTEACKGISAVLGEKFFNETETHDLYLLFCTKFLIYQVMLEKIVGADLLTLPFFSGTQMHKTCNNLLMIIGKENIAAETLKTAIYYILAYRLRDHKDNQKILEAANAYNLNKLFYWTKDNGIYLRKNLIEEKKIKYTEADGIAISSLTPEQLYQKLEFLLKVPEEKAVENPVLDASSKPELALGRRLSHVVIKDRLPIVTTTASTSESKKLVALALEKPTQIATRQRTRSFDKPAINGVKMQPDQPIQRRQSI